MKGKAHLIAGGVIGAGVANSMNMDLSVGISFTLLGSIVGLVPDLDVKGTLSQKLSLNKKWLTSLLGLVGLALTIYSLVLGRGMDKWLWLTAGVALLTVPPMLIKQKWMLFFTGAAILFIGIYVKSTWIVLFGVYVCAAANLPHRSLTHSLLGLAYFSVIGYFLEKELRLEHAALVCFLSYASHLLMDMKWIPFNKRGVKLFLPLSKAEF